jgi:hypothetical protein
LTYLYPLSQHVHSVGGDNSGGRDNISHTTQASSRIKKRNEWTPADEKKLVVINFIISFSQSGPDDVMILESTKQLYKNRNGSKFKRLHWWEAVRHQLKWRARLATSSTTDPFISSSEAAATEEVTHPIGRDRAKSAAWMGKGKKDSNSKSESSSAMVGIEPSWWGGSGKGKGKSK